ncbi:glycoside hydrolase family 5 protein [Urechidicola croceus]|uniref:Glycoside hydrolase n=1 Tax=Urechidicola croceus TaxID=1850246 RepID=A0A1D8PAK0_9FLAO|nr:glycoside hydrolase family 5 protein [Urechidicola croceus]AOW21587.1 glycoside hydrolase [Urechidicola croceus]
MFINNNFLQKLCFLGLVFLLISCNSKSKETSPILIHKEQSIVINDEKTPIELYGQLSVKGTKILDQFKNPVQLRGMSFFWSQWISKYYNIETLKWLKEDWRCNVVRIPLGIEVEGFLENPKKEKEKVFKMIDAAIELGMYIIIDWHDHNAENHLKESKEFFEEVAKRYGKYPNVIYEVYNAPLDNVSWSKVIKPYHEKLIKTIRKYDADNIIICGTRTWSQQIEEVADDLIDADNIVYGLHFYSSTHKQDIRDRTFRAIEKGVPVFVSEFGTSEASGDGFLDKTETELWWDFLDKNDISWVNWSISDKNETTSALKGGASDRGNWDIDEITVSGQLVREELRKKNPVPKKRALQ